MKRTFLLGLLFATTSAFAQFGGMPMFGFGFGMSPEMMEAAKKDFEKNLPLADQGDAAAQAIVAKAYLTGVGTSRNQKKGEKYAGMSAQKGCLEGAIELIRVYSDKKDKVKVVDALNKYIVPNNENQEKFIKLDRTERFVRNSMSYYIDETYKNADVNKLLAEAPQKVEFIKRWNTRSVDAPQPMPGGPFPGGGMMPGGMSGGMPGGMMPGGGMPPTAGVPAAQSDSVVHKRKVNIGPVENDEDICMYPDEPAMYAEGTEAMYEFLYSNIEYPEKAMEEGIQGRVTLRMVISAEGELENIEVIRSPNNDLSIAAIRVVLAMTAWKPGIKDGKPVKSYYGLPVNFRLAESEAKEKSE